MPETLEALRRAIDDFDAAVVELENYEQYRPGERDICSFPARGGACQSCEVSETLCGRLWRHRVNCSCWRHGLAYRKKAI